MAINCDIAILGGGIAGYTAAIKAAQAGKQVVLIEQHKLGGTCLHQGCIPSKALLRSAEVYSTLLQAGAYGIELGDAPIHVNFSAVQQRKDSIVDTLFKGLHYLMNKNGITVLHGKGRVIGPSIFSPRSGSVAVELPDGEMETVVPTHLIIATGSRPRLLEGLHVDGERVMTSDDLLRMQSLPRSILIIGGGVIGLEWASMLTDFGVEVTVLEAAPRLLPHEDLDTVQELVKQLKKRHVNIHTGVKLDLSTYGERDGLLHLEGSIDGAQHMFSAERIVVSVGRDANANTIGLENTDVQTTNGVISVNEHYQTSEPHIYAIGDVVGGLQLAHVAAHEAMIAVDHLIGAAHHVPVLRPHQVPKCIYSKPELASIGLSEEAARQQGHTELKIGRIPLQAIGKAHVLGEAEGFAKVIADAASGDLLGVHIIGAHATDLISEASLAMILDATPWEVGQAIHPHPTLSEVMGEAMLAVDGKAIAL